MKENTRGIYRHFGLKDIGKIKVSLQVFLFCISGTPDIIHQGIYFSINIRRKYFLSYMSSISIRRSGYLKDCHVFKLFFYISIIDHDLHFIPKEKSGRKITQSRCRDPRINMCFPDFSLFKDCKYTIFLFQTCSVFYIFIYPPHIYLVINIMTQVEFPRSST